DVGVADLDSEFALQQGKDIDAGEIELHQLLTDFERKMAHVVREHRAAHDADSADPHDRCAPFYQEIALYLGGCRQFGLFDDFGAHVDAEWRHDLADALKTPEILHDLQPANEVALALAALDQAGLAQIVKGEPNGDAADAKSGLQLAFRRELVVLGE